MVTARHPPTTPRVDTANRWPASGWGVWFGILGGPLAWALVLALGWWVSGASCLSGAPAWGNLDAAGVRTVVAAVALGCLALAVLALLFAWRAMRRRPEPSAASAMEARGRPDFLAGVALLCSSIFTIAVLWTGLTQLWLPLCERIR